MYAYHLIIVRNTSLVNVSQPTGHCVRISSDNCKKYFISERESTKFGARDTKCLGGATQNTNIHANIDTNIRTGIHTNKHNHGRL